MKALPILFSTLLATAAFAADIPTQPAVTVTATATASVANDRMIAWLRVEADNVDPAKAAAEVNGKMAKALARAKGTAGVEVSTSGYSSWQVYDKNLPNRWRVTQTITLEGSDFGTMATLVSRLQGDDALLLSGMSFAVSREARQKAEDALTQQAIKAWQARAQAAARGFGFDSWRTGRVSVQTGEPIRPIPMMRMQAAAAPVGPGAPPVNVEGGNTDVTVTVTGDAMLEGKR